MKSENGITLIVLVITVILMVILAAVGINAGFDSIESMKFQNFNYELQQIQGKVDSIHEKIKTGDTNYITLGSNITELSNAMQTLKSATGIDYNNVLDDQRESLYYNGTFTTYRYLTESQVREFLNISSNPGDLIINFLTREVISVEGFTYKGTTYYRLSDFGGNYISNGNTTINEILQTANNNSSQVHAEGRYIQDSLILHYDAINNTGNGHSNTATIWKDLSGNGNDGILHGVNGTGESGWHSNYIALDGIDDYIEKQGITVDGANGTVEIVTKYIDGIYIFRANASGNRTYIYEHNKTYKGDPAVRIYFNTTSYYDLASRVLKWYTQEETSYTQNYFNNNKSEVLEYVGTNNGTYISIGSQWATQSSNLAKMEVYSVRVYNRALTDAEVANNYAIDKARFGIEE